MATARAQQLANLANQLPVGNAQVASGLQAAQTAQLQQQIAGAGPSSNVQALGRPAGVQQAQGAANVQVQQAQSNLAQQTSLGQQVLSQQSQQARKKAFDNQINETALQKQLSGKLMALDRQAKKDLLDDQLTFKMDEGGRALMNNRQLADWALTNAKSQEDYARKAQDIQQASARKIAMMEMAQKKLELAIRQGYLEEGQKLDQESKMEIMKKANAIQQQIEKDKAKAANKAAVWQSGGALVGAVAGGLLGSAGGPAGTVAGASVGMSVGQGLGSILSGGVKI